MSTLSTISTIHIRKLDHSLNEIRLRTLINIISKFNLGFECDCNAVKKELLLKLFKWFSIEPVIEEEKVLDLLIKLIKSDGGSYLNSFGRLRFQNQLYDLRAKLDSKWYTKLQLLENIVSNPEKFIENFNDVHEITYDISESNDHCQNEFQLRNSTLMSPLDGSVPFELTMNCADGTVLSKISDSSIKWLIMPWQILASSDKGVLSTLEDHLNNSTDIAVKIESCQFITNIMLEDFPAEVFLQRPTTVNILLGLLEFHKQNQNEESQNLIITVLNTFYKLTRSLKFRINYYCDPSIAHKVQKILARNLQRENCAILQGRDSPEGEPPDQNIHSYQKTGSSNRIINLIDNSDDEVLRMQQLYIPHYCTDTLISVLKLLSIPNESSCPLKLVRYIADLVHELIQLLITSVMPTVWFCSDNIALNIHQNIKILFELLSEILQYFAQFDNVDYYRITYLYFLWISIKLISNIVPLELSDQLIPKKMKLCICIAIMDAPIYLMYPSLHTSLQEYARKFHGTQECETIKLLDETRLVTKSLKVAIFLMKNLKQQSYEEELKNIYSSKLSLLYHKNFKLIKQFMNLALNKFGYNLTEEAIEIRTKMIISLLAHNDIEVQETTYKECYLSIKEVLDGDFNSKYSWKNLIFLLESRILTEIICHGTTNENENIKNYAENILVLLLKGKIKMTEVGWKKFLEALIPVLPLLQCFAHPISYLGQCVTKMLDPDVFSITNIPFIEVLKGNIRLLFSSISDIRKEALCRLLWLLEQEQNSSKKLPRLTSLQDLPLGSICVFEKQMSTKRSEGNYHKSSLISVLEMLQSSNIEPKMKKSALVQISVMLSDPSLHKLFISENGVQLIINIFSNALIEKDFNNYPDSVIPIVTILKLLVSSENSIRYELSNQIDIYYNILRSLFLYPNNESIKIDAPQLLALLLYNGYIMKLTERSVNNPYNISLPCLITTNMKLPFTCKAHWKISVNRRSDISILHRNNPTALTFIRQFWAWEWNDGQKILCKNWQNINDSMINENLKINESEFACLVNSSIHYCSEQQLYNIQNSITHNEVSCAIDYLVIYLKLCKLVNNEEFEKILQLPWANTFERFLQSYPTNTEDHELFVNILNFLHFYIKLANNDETLWLIKTIKNMMKSLGEWLQSTEKGSEDIHQSVFRLARACAMIDTLENDESKNSWINFVEFAVSNLFYGEYYNLAFLDWVLSTLTFIVEKCQWKNNTVILMSIGNALIELILSFHREGTVSFMGLTITRDCIICLNHTLHHMKINLNKNLWIKFWYDQGSQSLNWLPELWRSRDPLVRASALQLLATLINEPHTALQLLNVINLSASELCNSLLYFITAQEESCIVKEQACLAMSNLIKNSNLIVFQYDDSLKPRSMLSYVHENNVYHEIAVMCSNCYMLPTLDPDLYENSESEGINIQSVSSSRSITTISMAPKSIYYLYNCADDFQKYVTRNSDNEINDYNDEIQFIATPSLISSLCLMLNNLIKIGEHEVIHEIFEHSLHKYIIGCFGDIPKNINEEINLDHYSSVLEMYTNLCTVLTNCIIHSPDFASIVVFSPDFIRHLFIMLNTDLYYTNTSRLVYLRNRLGTEILNFLVALSITENQHYDSIQTALETCDAESFIKNLCSTIKSSKSDFGLCTFSFLSFLLSLEMQKECEDNKIMLLKDILDSKQIIESNEFCDNDDQNSSSKSVPTTRSIENLTGHKKNVDSNDKLYIGSYICKVLIDLFIAHTYAKPLKKCKQSNDKDIIIGTLTNLLCISLEAKQYAILENFPNTCLIILKDIFIKIHAIPIQLYNSQNESRKIHSLLSEINSMYVLLMNFLYNSTEVKQIIAKAGLADIIHKLWVYTSLNKKVLITTLKLISTFTSDCLEAAHSLSLTSATPGVGLRKTPNSVSLTHVIIQLVITEIDGINRNTNNEKLNYLFHILRNAIHNHECRVVISKSNLLQFFPKIHPSTTKRTKLWQLVELYCLEFLIDFTFYDEGQLCVSKATDSLEVLIHLARLSKSTTRFLAISILRNLAFNAANRPRLLGSSEFLNLMLLLLKEGSITDIEVVGSALWALINNNQKGKLIIRSAGFEQRIYTAMSRLSLETSSTDGVQEQNLSKMLNYVLQILSPR